MQLTCKYGKNDKKVVTVNTTEQINVLLNKINDLSMYSYFVIGGKQYSLASIFTFNDVGITTDSQINIVTPSRAGFKINNL
jgi:hypothetical protein